MIYILWASLILVSYICGRGFLNICGKKAGSGGCRYSDCLIMGFIIILGITEAVHCFGVFGHKSFSAALRLWQIIIVVCVVLALAAGLLISGNKRHIGRKTKHRKANQQKIYKGINKNAPISCPAYYLGFLTVLLFVLQFIITQVGNNIYIAGDMTVETAGSFIAKDSFYSVNPLTGAAYAVGVPSRIKLLSLPSLYAFLAATFHMEVTSVVWRAVPAFVLLCAYAAYLSLANTLFSNDVLRRNLFMLIVSAVFFAGDYMYGMDGFLLLQSGFRGVAVRNLVLLPYLISLVLRKKWLMILFVIAAEACIVWTLYGMGACLLTAVLLSGVQYALGKRRRNPENSLETEAPGRIFR